MSMQKFVKFIAACIGIFAIIVVVRNFNSALPGKSPPSKDDYQTTTPCSSSTCFGIVGYSPVGFPKQSLSAIKTFWRETNAVAELYGVTTSLENIGIITQANKEFSGNLVLVIPHTALRDYEKIRGVIKKNPKIKYLGIGNEINILYNDSNSEYKEFLALAKQYIPKIKEDFPQVTIFTVFQYDELVGRAYLTGKKNPDQRFLLQEWSTLVDMIGLTVYPHFQYDNPEEIPQEYFTAITSTTTLPIAITETSWPSGVKIFTGGNAKYNTTEQEQSVYAEWMKNEATKRKFVFVNWLFLNDLETGQPLFQGSALRDSEGKAKLVLPIWSK
ncbi:hypothetical protein IT418_02295 [bacterium]|nr:hypothetical protein [bacterium]